MTQTERGAGTRELLRLEGVKKHYPVTSGLILQRAIGVVKAVDGVSLTIPEGHTYSLVGESGCGKTTTSRMVLMVEPPTGGEAFPGKIDGAPKRGGDAGIPGIRQGGFSGPVELSKSTDAGGIHNL